MNRFIRTVVFAMVILIGALTGCQSLMAQKTVTMYLVDRGWSGDTNYIELRCAQFQKIAFFQFSIKEENNLGSFYSLDQINLQSFAIGVNTSIFNNILSVSWNSPFINGYNNPDGAALFRIKWISNPAFKHCYTITGIPLIIKSNSPFNDTVTAIQHSSCESLLTIPSFFNAYHDVNNNCQFDNQETLFSSYTVQDSFNQNIRIYKNPQLLIYAKQDFGRHYYKVIPQYPVWTSCNTEQVIDLDSTTQIISLTYGIQALISCPELEVEIHAATVRRCLDYKYYISYANSGTKAEDSAKIRIKLDPYMSFISSSIPGANVQYPFVEFNLGRLDIFQSGEFNITVNVDCNSTKTGQTHCATAQILPHYDCFVSPLWSGANIKLDAKCDTGKVKFRIQNTGAQNMQESTQYWIVEDDIMPGLKKDIKLNAGQFIDLEFPGNGKSYRIIADQVKNHPGHSNPTVALEACGRDNQGNFSTGYVLLFAEDEEDPDVSIDCQASKGSFDPNDKTGLPLGYGPEQFIEPLRTLEYKIRFQNTGNDTAFKVMIVDTLSEWMDLKTFKVLGASHEFSFSLVDRVLSFRFDPIYLPYQSIDEDRSSGYVIYSVQPKKETPLQTAIHNVADIYFDFNPPIRTNTTKHTLATNFIIVSVEPADPYNTNANIYPNPGTDFLIIESDRMSMDKDLVIYDIYGHPAISQKLSGKRCQVSLHNALKPGVYLLQLRDSKQQSFSTKIVVGTKN